MTDIASLGLRIDSAQVESGVTSLDKLSAAAAQAEKAEEGLQSQAKETGNAIAGQSASAKQAAEGVQSLADSTKDLAKSEQDAKQRIRDMVAASLDQKAAALSAASATRETSRAVDAANRAPSSGAGASLTKSFSDTREELTALDDALAHQSASLEDVGEKRQWLTGLYERGLVSAEDNAAAMKKLSAEESALTKTIRTHGDEVSRIVDEYAPADAALRKIAEDEIKLQKALAEGVLTQQQYNKAAAGLGVNRAKYQAEAAAVAELSSGLKGLSLTSSYALREYTAIINGLGRGNIGQVAREIGSLGIRTGALALLFNPVGIALTGVVGGLGLLAGASLVAERENRAFGNALTFSGNAAGATREQLKDMAREIGGIVGTQHSASAALAEFAATGKVSAENLKEFVTIAEELEKTAGTPVAETAKQFAELGRSPVEASKRLNEQYHFLTGAVYAQIKALEEQGLITEAGELAQRTFATSQSERLAEAKSDLGTVERAWLGIKTAVARAGDAILDIGRTSDTQKLKALADERKSILEQSSRAEARSFPTDGLSARLKEIENEEEAIKKRTLAENDSARAKALEAHATEEQIRQKDRERAIVEALSASLTQTRTARLGADQSAVQRQLSEDLAAFKIYDSTLEQLRGADLINAKTYYQQKKALIETDTSTRVKALQTENALIRQESALVRQAADEQQSRAKGPDQEAARIRIEADAQTKIIANQNKIRDNESKMFEVRRQSAAQITELSIPQQAAARAVIDQLEEETNELEIQAVAGIHAAEAIERLRRAKALDKAGVTDLSKVDAAASNRDDARNRAAIAAAKEELRVTSLGRSERDRDTASRKLAGNATKDQVDALVTLNKKSNVAGLFNEQFESIRRDFDSFSADYVLSYKQMYEEIDRRVKDGVVTEQEAAHARELIAKSEVATRIHAAETIFGGLEGLATTKNRKLFEIGKAAAIANATISAAQAITNAYATQPWYLGLAQGIAAAGILATQINQIKNTQFQGYMSGGYTGDLPPTAVAGVVHGREFVMNEAATSRIGVGNLNALQAGTLKASNADRYDGSGWKGGGPRLNVTVQNYGSSKIEVQQLSASEVRIIARDEAQKTVGEQAPALIASEISNPNSKVSKSLSKNTQAQRKR